MPTEQPDGNIRDLKDFKDIQRACCKAMPLSLEAHKGPADFLGGWSYFLIFGLSFRLFGVKTVFFSFFMRNHAEPL